MVMAVRVVRPVVAVEEVSVSRVRPVLVVLWPVRRARMVWMAVVVVVVVMAALVVSGAPGVVQPVRRVSLALMVMAAGVVRPVTAARVVSVSTG